MRRDEFRTGDREKIQAVADACEVGYLGVTDPDGYPRVIPLNFVLLNRCVYFHGADEGEKYKQYLQRPRVSFSMVDEYSMIPSYWLSKEYACPATVFFKSVYVRGVGTLVEDLEEKAAAMQALMEKHQPEGGYRPITATDPMYVKPLREVSVFRLDPERIVWKFKFGQNMNDKTRRGLMNQLRSRDKGPDAYFAAQIGTTLPLTENM